MKNYSYFYLALLSSRNILCEIFLNKNFETEKKVKTENQIISVWQKKLNYGVAGRYEIGVV